MTERAYNGLLAAKKDGESFSEVVIRVLAERKDPRILLTPTRPLPGFDAHAFHREAAARDRARLDELHCLKLRVPEEE